jgi:hypothetical protein
MIPERGNRHDEDINKGIFRRNFIFSEFDGRVLRGKSNGAVGYRSSNRTGGKNNEMGFTT